MGAGNPDIDRLVGTRVVSVHPEGRQGIAEFSVSSTAGKQCMVEFS